MNIAMVGTGYVGLVTGVCFAELGLHVTCADKDEKRIAMLAKGEVPLYEPQLGEMLRRNLQQGRIHFTTDTASAVKESLVVFIAVGTPSKEDGSADLGYVEEVARTVARNLDGYKVIVTKSTVPVGTGRKIQQIIREEIGNGSQGVFDVASNPEFLREGSAVEDFLRPNRVVIGADSPQAIAILLDLYRPIYLIETPFVVTTIEAAELIKYAANSFLATKITFMNEMANLCDSIGVDVHVVAKAMGLDQRIGPKFLHPGPGFGGSCFPKDTLALTQIAKERGCRARLVETVVEVNEQQKLRMVEKIVGALGVPANPGSLEGITVGVLGLAFKPNTDDVREAPSLVIIRELQRRGARVQAYDPAAMEQAQRVLPDVDCLADAYNVAEGADVVVLMTEWNQFRNLDLEKIKGLMRRPILVDLRNVYTPERVRALGFDYYGVGR
ncbi:UDP-glucose/GDP-mannose dehydrogenase family protein [Candidatus Methylomirabilis sp.]|uniref:UDP-glucose dehydrogenase family protein n=1 Tax=Candidatus Methylomirabilis sp. TaxID=2032687 RepID=UPI00307611B4